MNTTLTITLARGCLGMYSTVVKLVFFFLLRAVEKDVGCLASESVSRINQSADQAIDAPATDCSAKCANAVGTTATRHTCCMKGTPIANHTGHWIDSGSRCVGCPTCLARIIATVICLEWAWQVSVIGKEHKERAFEIPGRNAFCVH